MLICGYAYRSLTEVIPLLNDEVRDIWNTNAEFWDGRMGEGNNFHKTLLEPTQLKLLDIQPGQRILDIACGNGQFARKMASLGARVTAVDFADNFIRIARARSSPEIDFRVIDVTSDKDMSALQGLSFDSVVCTMAIMDMADIDVLVRSLPALLQKDGRFVFSITHPCFNSGEAVQMHEREDLGGVLKDRYSVKMSNYLLSSQNLGLGMVGQPRPQYYFHRPLSRLLNSFFQAGLVLDALEEPSFPADTGSERLFDNVFQNMPPALVCRLTMVRHGSP
jgi:SAM-dependent methyltransferase